MDIGVHNFSDLRIAGDAAPPPKTAPAGRASSRSAKKGRIKHHKWGVGVGEGGYKQRIVIKKRGESRFIGSHRHHQRRGRSNFRVGGIEKERKGDGRVEYQELW